jgi:uncharacterized protein YprB with RNaseH-like and TPR domain
MSIINIGRLTKDEIVKRANWRCPVKGHSKHNGLEHPKCYEKLKDLEEGEKIGFLDIETSNLKADFGIIFSYCIKEHGGKILGRSLTKEELLNEVYDKELLKECNEDMRKFDKVVGYYSTKFDIPYLRTRSTYWKLDFPVYKEVKHTDVYYIIKNKFNLHRNRLETACDFFSIEAKTHPLMANIWFRAMVGDKKALSFIFSHNKEDVVSLEKLYDLTIKYAYPCNKSI